MIRRPIFQLGQKWPDGLSDNSYWIGTNPNHARVSHNDGLVIMGQECSSLTELEAVAACMREDLDKVLEEARKKLVDAGCSTPKK